MEHPCVKIYVDNHADKINSEHNLFSKYILHRVIWKSVAKLMKKHVICFWGVTESRCDFLLTEYKLPSSKVDLLLMGVDDVNIPFDQENSYKKEIRAQLRIPENSFLIITGGKIDSSKRIDKLLEAIILLANPMLHILIFGNISPDIEFRMKKLINKNANMHYIGWIDSKELYKYVFASNMAVYPGTHSVLWEQSVGLGIPCVFRYWKGMTHVDVGGNCCFIKNDEIKDLVEILDNIINNPEKYSLMLLAAKIKGRASFSYSYIAKKSIQLC